MRYYEDMLIGQTERYGAYAVTREEVIGFAGKYDPQPFHLDDDAAAATYFGRLSASGFHTASMMMAMMVKHWQEGDAIASLGSPGLDELRWIKPVYPGDVLRVESTLLEKRRSQNRPEMGITKTRSIVFNQHDEPVLSVIANGLIRVRQPTMPEMDA